MLAVVLTAPACGSDKKKAPDDPKNAQALQEAGDMMEAVPQVTPSLPWAERVTKWGRDIKDGCYAEMDLERLAPGDSVSCKDSSARWLVEHGAGESAWLRLSRLVPAIDMEEGGVEEQWAASYSLDDGTTLSVTLAERDEKGRILSRTTGEAGPAGQTLRTLYFDPATGEQMADYLGFGRDGNLERMELKLMGKSRLRLQSRLELDLHRTSTLEAPQDGLRSWKEWTPEGVLNANRSGGLCKEQFDRWDAQALEIASSVWRALKSGDPVPERLSPFPLSSCCGPAMEGLRDGAGNCLPGSWREIPPGWRSLGLVPGDEATNAVWTLESSQGVWLLSASVDADCDGNSEWVLEREIRESGSLSPLQVRARVSPALDSCMRESERPLEAVGVTLRTEAEFEDSASVYADGRRLGTLGKVEVVPGPAWFEVVGSDSYVSGILTIGDMGSVSGELAQGCTLALIAERCPDPHRLFRLAFSSVSPSELSAFAVAPAVEVTP